VRGLTAALVLAIAASGCGAQHEPRAKAPASGKSHPRPPLKRVHCPAAAGPGCRSAIGRVLYVEAKDPDGDGDAHFVLASDQSVSGPGITAIDVERSMRPERLPRVGDWVTAAGHVYRGGYGQRQIQATVLRIARDG
jgi:hypothetical protein